MLLMTKEIKALLDTIKCDETRRQLKRILNDYQQRQVDPGLEAPIDPRCE